MTVAKGVNVESDARDGAGCTASVTAGAAVSGREIGTPLMRLDTGCLVCQRTHDRGRGLLREEFQTTKERKVQW
jgi:hypothetical protein